MEKEFVSYELALELKELGFDEPCFAYATMEYKYVIHCGIGFKVHKESDLPTKPFGVPTWQSAFRWFREKYKLDSYIRHECPDVELYYDFVIDEDVFDVMCDYEEAELECLKKLIEIVKNSRL